MTVIDEIADERKRQIEVEGWTPEHDDKEHRGAGMAVAASCYALSAAGKSNSRSQWPWSLSWWKPKDRRRDLIRAGALIVAEIERIDRANQKDAHQD